MMNTKSVAEEMLSEVGLTPVDSARLVLETIELLGTQARSLSRPELVSLLRETIHAGVAAMQAATHTVSLEQAAWARVEAGKELRASTRGDLRHFVRRMLRVEGAAEWQLRAIPGIAFGCDHAIRISYCTSLDVLKEGLDRIEEFLKKH